MQRARMPGSGVYPEHGRNIGRRARRRRPVCLAHAETARGAGQRGQDLCLATPSDSRGDKSLGGLAGGTIVCRVGHGGTFRSTPNGGRGIAGRGAPADCIIGCSPARLGSRSAYTASAPQRRPVDRRQSPGVRNPQADPVASHAPRQRVCPRPFGRAREDQQVQPAESGRPDAAPQRARVLDRGAVMRHHLRRAAIDRIPRVSLLRNPKPPTRKPRVRKHPGGLARRCRETHLDAASLNDRNRRNGVAQPRGVVEWRPRAYQFGTHGSLGTRRESQRHRRPLDRPACPSRHESAVTPDTQQNVRVHRRLCGGFALRRTARAQVAGRSGRQGRAPGLPPGQKGGESPGRQDATTGQWRRCLPEEQHTAAIRAPRRQMEHDVL